MSKSTYNCHDYGMDDVFNQLKWYYVTRSVGLIMVLYELFSPAASPERGTLILAGCGILGFDYVARKDKAKVDED